MKKFVAWDTERRLSFAVPFTDMKPVIYLDPFLPRISELALSTSDRQTKVCRRCLQYLGKTTFLNLKRPFLKLKKHAICLTFLQVAACELLHSLVVYMVGKSAQMVEGKSALPPMYKLHKRLFPVLLRLACDVDQVCVLFHSSDRQTCDFWNDVTPVFYYKFALPSLNTVTKDPKVMSLMLKYHFIC